MSLPRPLRRLVRRLLAGAGYEIRRLAGREDLPLPRPSAELASVLDRLASLGVRPATVFDVGAAAGTPELYARFPHALHVFVEPLEEFRPRLEAIAATVRAELVPAAAGARPGTRTLHVHRDLLGSSLLGEVEGPAVDGTPREVAVVTLDDLVRERGLAPPFLIKADVQGAELEVLEGARETLRATDAVVLEASLFRFFRGGADLAEVVAWMRATGFAVWDVWGRLERPLDGALAQLDLAFVRDDGPLRRDHRFATPEQRRP